MGINIKTFKELAIPILENKYPILVRGEHGIGKSEIVYQIGKALGLPVIERRFSQMTEGDLLGLPFTNGETTDFNPMSWFYEACTKPVLLFLDEIDRAIPELRQGAFQLMDSRALNGRKLHPDTVVIAAINGGEGVGSKYQVHEMDPAEIDRYAIFDLDPTVEEWCEYATDVCDELVVDFIRNYPSHLEYKKKEFEPGKIYPSRRSWVRLNNVLVSKDLLKVDDITPNLVTIYHLAHAFVGLEAAMAFRDFAKNYKRSLSIEQFLAGKGEKLYSKYTLNEHNAFIEKLEHNKVFSRDLTQAECDAAAKYLMSLPGEIAMRLFQIINHGKTETVRKVMASGAKPGVTPTPLAKFLKKVLDGTNHNKLKKKDK